MYSGHYVAFIKIEDNWYLFDDAKVVKTNPAIVFNQSAYMLFYRKKYVPTPEEILEREKLQKELLEQEERMSQLDVKKNAKSMFVFYTRFYIIVESEILKYCANLM